MAELTDEYMRAVREGDEPSRIRIIHSIITETLEELSSLGKPKQGRTISIQKFAYAIVRRGAEFDLKGGSENLSKAEEYYRAALELSPEESLSENCINVLINLKWFAAVKENKPVEVIKKIDERIGEAQQCHYDMFGIYYSPSRVLTYKIKTKGDSLPALTSILEMENPEVM